MIYSDKFRVQVQNRFMMSMWLTKKMVKEKKESGLSKQTISLEAIEQRIFLMRGHKVMLDRDLAALYSVKAIALRQQVKRNKDRFPPDFMFQLSRQETDILLSQNVIPSRKSLGGYNPYAFTEQGVAMLSSILRSKRAVEVNIAIMRTFVKLRQILADNALLRSKIESMERKYDEQFEQVFTVLKYMIAEETKPKQPFGFRSKKDKPDKKK